VASEYTRFLGLYALQIDYETQPVIRLCWSFCLYCIIHIFTRIIHRAGYKFYICVFK